MDYIEAFKNLKTNNKYSRKSPHKAVLLLAIIEMYENNVLTDNELFYDETLKSTFLKVWNKVLPGEAKFLPEAYLPFWYMQSEEFWHIVPIRGKEDILTLMRDNHIKPSESKLRDCVRYAELDEDLYFMMTMPSGRTTLRRVLLETYTSLSPRMVEKIAISTDNFIDNSIVALNEYEEILSGSDKKETKVTKKVDSESQNLFAKLSEDIQITLNLEYFTFLKNHRQERELFKEVFPSVYDIYKSVAITPIIQGEISPSLTFVYDNFLCDLKITLMSEDGSMELIDKINVALDKLRGVPSYEPIPIEEELVESYNEPVVHSIDIEHTATESSRVPLSPAFESRKGKPWTVEEEQKISTYYELGYPIEEISIAIGRTEVSIKTRLASLGLIDYVFGEEIDTTTDIIEERESKPLDFYIENSSTRGSIFNIQGERVYTVSGQLKIFNGKPYRFNYKEMCFTVKDLIRKGDSWEKGTKKIVSYENTDLYPLLNQFGFIDQIEDLIEGCSWEDNQIRVDGKWFDFKGYYLKDAESKNDFSNEQENKIESICVSDFKPKGQLKCIDGFVTNAYDYLWLIAIVYFMGEKQQSTTISYDNIACMMIANAWEILNDHPKLREKESVLTECIEFLIEESKQGMDSELYWSSHKDLVYETIKDYPMSDKYEDTVETILENAPVSMLAPWIKIDNKNIAIAASQNFQNACLYAIHPKKYDSYIEINSKWVHYLTSENNNLMKYLQHNFINFKR